MSVPVLLPDLGLAGETLRVSVWFVESGEAVDEGERLVEVLARGITFDVPAPASGVVARVEKPLDAAVAPGDVLGWIETQEGTA